MELLETEEKWRIYKMEKLIKTLEMMNENRTTILSLAEDVKTLKGDKLEAALIDLEREQIKATILKNNAKLDLLRAAWSYITEILNKYAGKKYGPKTKEKMQNDLYGSCKCTFYIEQKSHEVIIRILNFGKKEYYYGLEVTGYINGGVILKDNVIQAAPEELPKAAHINNYYYPDVDYAAGEIIEKYEETRKIATLYEEARRDYMRLHVEGLNEPKFLPTPRAHIV